MENYLYLLEFFVETVTFSANSPESPHPYEVVMSGSVGKSIKIDVFTVQNLISGNDQHKELQLNCGRSVLFASTPSDFLQKINEHPFTISVFIKNKMVGEGQIGWTKDFYNLLKKSFDNFTDLTPAAMQDQVLYLEKDTNRIMGDIKASVRLTCFGVNLLTSFQMINTKKDGNKKFLVKGAKGETTFECQKIKEGYSGEVLPMTTLFAENDEPKQTVPLTTIFDSKGPAASGRHPEESSIMFPLDNERMSLMALFKSAMDPKISSRPEEFNMALQSVFPKQNLSTITFDIVSLRERPDENKFIDFRIKGGSQGLVFEFDAAGHTKPDEKWSMSSKSSHEHEEPTELTVDQINKMLCKNKDCPAAKKFKDLGIGPLAKTGGLGGLYQQPSLPVTYGLSQTYGVFDEYGPYGLFSRPKRPSTPFIPKQESDWAASCWTPKPCKKAKRPTCDCQERMNARLAGGGVNPPLRLTGGGAGPMDYNDVKSPFHECKEVLDQMDHVIHQYKKALGPCGMTTCPFAPNVTKESCKKMCSHEMDVYSMSDIAVPKTPRDPTPNPKPKAPACGSPKCAYAKYKLGLTPEDAEMELRNLPMPATPYCGHPKCPNACDRDLPPIHWDCPDPLPEGKCKNSRCPYLPKEIKCLNEVLGKGPCGNFNCPFAPPAPCDSPYCPFQKKECPYENDEDEGSICENPDCPYAQLEESPQPQACPGMMMNPFLQNLLYCAMMQNADTIQVCMGHPQLTEDGNCLTKKPSPCHVEDQAAGCDHPNCPHKKNMARDQGGACDQGDGEQCLGEEGNGAEEICENPDCPYNPGASSCYRPKKKKDLCENPDCPYAPPKPPPCVNPLQALLSCMPITICPDGACPYGGTKTLNLCFGGPGCPYQEENKPQQKQPSIGKDRDDLCGNPRCPFAPQKESSGGAEHVVETRTEVDNAPCTPETCTATGGTVAGSDLCTCGQNPSDGAQSEAERVVETRTEVDNAPCMPKTCTAKGGTVAGSELCTCCKSAPAMGESGGQKKKNKKKKGKYVYSVGDKYPGVQIGHRTCVMRGSNVPAKMGWLWNVQTVGLKARRGWRPGALTKTIAERIRKHRESQGLEKQELKNRPAAARMYSQNNSAMSVNVQPKPTLQIKKQDGCYWITMNPLKDPHTLVENENPYMDCTPLQFKICKNKDKEKEANDEYRSCFCGDDEQALSSSSDSELEIEFTPPAGIIHPERFKRKRNVVHIDTQYMTSDFEKKKSQTAVEEKKSKGKKGKGKKGKKDKKKKKK